MQRYGIIFNHARVLCKKYSKSMKKVTFIYKMRVFFDVFLIFDEFSSILTQ